MDLAIVVFLVVSDELLISEVDSSMEVEGRCGSERVVLLELLQDHCSGLCYNLLRRVVCRVAQFEERRVLSEVGRGQSVALMSSGLLLNHAPTINMTAQRSSIVFQDHVCADEFTTLNISI